MRRLTVRCAAAVAVGLAVGLLAGGASAQPPEVESLNTVAGPISVVELATGLEHPWGMAFLPNGRLLVTERAGRLRILPKEGELSDPVPGVPEVWAQGQGGLLDVAVDPDFDQNRYVYLSYAKPGPDGQAATALGRGKLTDDDRLDGFTELFLQQPWIKGPNHFGSRIVFAPDGKLFLTLGERFQFDPAQDPTNTLGVVVRLNRDGSIPDDNPFAPGSGGGPNGDADPAIYSYGHRNVQAAAMRGDTGELWITEMGPLGGDELNRPEPGKNYGWPTVSWGLNYDGSPIPQPPTRPEFADAVHHWSPVLSPSGMTWYDSDTFAPWKGTFMIGGLSAHDVVIVRLDGDRFAEEYRLPLPDRVRDVEAASDGTVYVLIDKPKGNVWRLEPMR